MGQVVLFTLFMITLLAGIYFYFSPTPKAVNPTKVAVDDNGFNPQETLTRKRDLQVDMKTSGGIVQILKKMDDLTQERNKLTDTIEDEQEALKNTKKEIADLLNQAVKSDQDLLRLKVLGEQMQDQESLLVANGQQLVALNDELTKSRQWIADQSNLVNMNNQSSLESLQEHNAMINDKASMLADKAKQQNSDAAQHAQDEQEMIQQRIADQEQRMQDQENR